MSLAYDVSGQGGRWCCCMRIPDGAWTMWQPQRVRLGQVCRLITPDLPGFGDSPLLAGTPTVDAMKPTRAAVAGLLDELGVKEPVILGGLSMGGYVSFAFVRRHPQRLAGLILADTRAEPDDDTAKANRDKLIGFAATNRRVRWWIRWCPSCLARRWRRTRRSSTPGEDV
ncbi:MAG: alpha/beta hydrolase [Gemmataceae bacterium]